MISATAFAPATVSNVGCGFDVLGFALDHPGDEVTARFLSGDTHGVLIESIDGDNGRLPRDAARNTAGVAALALLTKLGERRGIGAEHPQRAAAVERPRRERGQRRRGGRRGRRADRRPVDHRYADCLRARRRAARRGIGARRQHRAVHLRRVRAGPPPVPARHPAGCRCRRVDGRRRPSRSRDRNGEGPRPARHDGAAQRCGPAVGQHGRARRRTAPRRFRAHQPRARRHDCRTAPGVAGAWSCRHQARRGGGGRARLQFVGIRARRCLPCAPAPTPPPRSRPR